MSFLPPTENPTLDAEGVPALYNPALYTITLGIFQHGVVFGILFLLRNFSSKRALDLHYLTLIFALSLIAGGLVFLVDQSLNAVKLFFFLEHEAVEFLIAIRVLALDSFVQDFSGRIILFCWTVLSIITIAVSFNQFYGTSAMVVAWGAFISDLSVGLSGGMLVVRWFTLQSRHTPSRLMKVKTAAEASAGVGFMLHGFTTMCVGPIFTRILYDNLDPSWFAWAWVLVFSAAMFTVGLSVPCVAIFFNTIQWCCWHRKKVLPGQAAWGTNDDNNEDDDKEAQRQVMREMLQTENTGNKMPWDSSHRLSLNLTRSSTLN